MDILFFGFFNGKMTDLHPSETSLDDYSLFSYTIMNDGTLDDLLNKVRDILGDLKKKSYI